MSDMIGRRVRSRRYAPGLTGVVVGVVDPAECECEGLLVRFDDTPDRLSHWGNEDDLEVIE